MSYSSYASYEPDWTVVCNKKKKVKKVLSKAPLMKLDNNDFKMSIRVLSVERREIERRSMKEGLSKKAKRGGVRTRISKLLRSSGHTFITRKMVDKLIEAERMKKVKDVEEHVEDHVEDKEMSEPVKPKVHDDEPNYGMVGDYFDPHNLSVVSPCGVKCEDVLEKAARISAWWTRVLGYKVY
jgi:hypothetical protein